MHYYIEQRRITTGLWEKRECTTGRKELKKMTAAERSETLKRKLVTQPTGFTVRLIETDTELKEVPFEKGFL